MSRLFKRSEEEHNFWQNYTDLMSGFLIVFIIASLVAYSRYQAYVDIFEKNTNGEVTPEDVIVNAELYKKIRDFQVLSQQLGDSSQYYRYNDEAKRFECKLDVQFNPTETTIRPQYHDRLIEAGRELKELIKRFEQTTNNVAFKIIIEGRAANNKNINVNNGKPWVKGSKIWAENEVRSYERARALKGLWENNGIFSDTSPQSNYDIIVCGSGFGGKNRNPTEDDNKTFIIQIIPYINF